MPNTESTTNEEVDLDFSHDDESNRSKSDEGEKNNESNQFSDEVSHAVIYEAGSLTNFDQVMDRESLEAQIAASRGDGDIEAVEERKDNQDGVTFELTKSEGRLKTESNYLIRFVDTDLVRAVEDEQTGLSVFDIMKIESLKDYPAPEKLIESLPPHIHGRLKEYSYVQVQGAYQSNAQRFYGVRLGWRVEENIDPWDRIMQIVSQVSTTTGGLDYAFVKHGPDRWGVDEIADARGIDKGSVRNNVRSVENELDE